MLTNAGSRICRAAVIAVSLAAGLLCAPAGAQSLMERAAAQGQSAARDSARSLYLRAARLAQQGRYGTAIEAMRGAIDYLPNDPQLKVDLGVLLAASGDMPGARAALEDVAGGTPVYPPAILQLADLAVSEGDTARAVTLLEGLVDGDVAYPPASVRLGDLAQATGNREGAADHYRRAIATDLDYIDGHLRLGAVLVIMDRYDEAIQAFDRALTLAPGVPNVADIRSLAVQRKLDYDEGMAQGKMRARIIVLANEREAEEVRGLVVGGADFITLAVTRSIHPTADVGGDLGFFERGEMIPAFADPTSALRPGGISPVIRIPSGWAIILRVN